MASGSNLCCNFPSNQLFNPSVCIKQYVCGVIKFLSCCKAYADKQNYYWREGEEFLATWLRTVLSIDKMLKGGVGWQLLVLNSMWIHICSSLNKSLSTSLYLSFGINLPVGLSQSRWCSLTNTCSAVKTWRYVNVIVHVWHVCLQLMVIALKW